VTPFTAGIIGFFLLLLLFALRLPVAFSMALAGFLGFGYLISLSGAFTMIAMQITAVFSSYTYASVIMFIWMGNIAFHSGLSANLYRAAHAFVGHIRGGLAMATVVACALFGAICGSTLATAATFAAISLPEMKKHGYDDGLATGTVASGAILGIMIPPSIPLIIYGIFTQQSIGGLFIATIVPGILLMSFYLLTISFLLWRHPEHGPAGEKSTARQKVLAVFGGGTIEVIIVFVVVLGGMFMGFFTPTEAGAVGGAAMFAIAFVRRRLTRKAVVDSLVDTTKTAAMVFTLLVGAQIFGAFMAASRIPMELSDLANTMKASPFLTLILVLGFNMFLGCIMDGTAALVLSLPIVFPLISAVGFDPLWFGVMMNLYTGLGCITPPVGLNAYIVAGVSKGVPLTTVFRGVLPFIAAIVVYTFLMIAFPQLATFLPALMK
jgi:tripartite ATP-independent transporter DctM subunit